MNESQDESYLLISGRLFALVLPRLVIAFVFVRYAIEWATSSSNSAFLEWVSGRWLFDLVLTVSAAAFEAFTNGYRKWLGPSYAQWRRSDTSD